MEYVNTNYLRAYGGLRASNIESSKPLDIISESQTNIRFPLSISTKGITFNYYKEGVIVEMIPIGATVGQIGSSTKPFTNGYFVNSINVTSDRNKKENIQYLEDKDSKLTLKDCYDYIQNVYKPATYNLIDSSSSNKKIGIIAQDSENSNVGDLIVEKINDNYTLNEYAHSSAIGAALKQAILEIENLKQEIEKLKAK